MKTLINPQAYLDTNVETYLLLALVPQLYTNTSVPTSTIKTVLYKRQAYPHNYCTRVI